MKKLLLVAITASLLAAVIVAVVSLLQTPSYEASALLKVGQEQQKSHGGIHPLPPPGDSAGDALIQTMIIYIDTPPVAREAIRRLALEVSPGELLQDLTIRQVESSRLIRLTYTDTDPGPNGR